jgi:hypothetical protein
MSPLRTHPATGSVRSSRSWLVACIAAFVVTFGAGCKVPYPVVVNAGPFVVPPTSAREPLQEGARVLVLPQAPPGCLFLGLATGVGGIADQYEGTSDSRFPEFQRRALTALRNAVARVGGTHTVVDAEVTFTEPRGVTHVLLRGPALLCR